MYISTSYILIDSKQWFKRKLQIVSIAESLQKAPPLQHPDIVVFTPAHKTSERRVECIFMLTLRNLGCQLFLRFVSKTIPDILSLIIASSVRFNNFGRNVTYKIGNQKTLYFPPHLNSASVLYLAKWETRTLHLFT